MTEPTSSLPQQRLRLVFAKKDAMRYTSHLDLHRTWERTMRRAELPLAYTLGFSPHPRINLGSALPLGFTSQQEVVDIWFEVPLPLEQVSQKLTPALPPGLEVLEMQEVDMRLPALQTQLLASEYVLTFTQALPDLAERCAHLLAAPSLPRRRRNKDYDLRPLIEDLIPLPDDEQGRPRLTLRISARESATGRPEEVIDVLGQSIETTRVHRTRLIFQEEV